MKLESENTDHLEHQKPNVIFIICDDLNNAISGMGRTPCASAPNLQSLMSKGVRFTNAHSNCPVCLPPYIWDNVKECQMPHPNRRWLYDGEPLFSYANRYEGLDNFFLHGREYRHHIVLGTFNAGASFDNFSVVGEGIPGAVNLEGKLTMCWGNLKKY